MSSRIHFVDKGPIPSLMPILRSQQQAEILALVLGDPSQERSVTEVADATNAPYASVHREIERAEEAGLITSRRVGNVRLIRADVASPYFEGLADVLVKAFGPPRLLADALQPVDGVDAAFIYGSWASAAAGDRTNRPVADIDLLVLGEPDRDVLYEAIRPIEERLGRPIDVTIRPTDWLETGTGPFHETVIMRPMRPLDVRGEVNPAPTESPPRPG